MKTKNQKGFIQIPLLIAIIAGVLVLGSGGYFGLKQYQKYRTNKIEKEKIVQEEKKADEEKEQLLKELINAQKVELEKQKGEIEKIKNKQGVIINNSSNNSSQANIADIVAQWTPNIVRISCLFKLSTEAIAELRSYGMTNTAPIISYGSGFLKSINDSGDGSRIVVITNHHVLSGHNGFSPPFSCEVTLSDGHKYFTDNNDTRQLTGGLEEKIKFIKGQPYVIPPIDAGFLIIKNPNIYTTNLARNAKICETAPRIGDGVIILGFPSIGSSASITATEGIVSGIEGDYYLTSAKVEHGNSGGAAILKDQNCYFGIPSFAITGEIESLARILNFKTIFP